MNSTPSFFNALIKFLQQWTPVMSNYQEIARKFQDGKVAIRSANPDELKALLTWAFLGERFCEGFWRGLVQDGRATAMVMRLDELNHLGEIVQGE